MRDLREHPLVKDLLRGENLPGRPDRVELRFTHGSFVFLTRTDVFKVKRAKDYGFFDFTTLEAREHDCREEVRLNRRTAPDVYLGVVAVRRDERGHSLVRGGEIVDWAVHMRRLPDDRSAQALVECGALTRARLAELAAFLARFYARAEERDPDPQALVSSFEENFAQVRPFAGRYLDAERLARLERRQRAWLAEHADLVERRPARDGHGDLRLEHVYFLEEGIAIIDCIEFCERFRIGDPALDVAFLAMDLHWRGRADLANALFEAFAERSGDFGFAPLVGGYLSYRATVRAKVACFVADDPETPRARAARKVEEARALLNLALRLLDERPAALGGRR